MAAKTSDVESNINTEVSKENDSEMPQKDGNENQETLPEPKQPESMSLMNPAAAIEDRFLGVSYGQNQTACYFDILPSLPSIGIACSLS